MKHAWRLSLILLCASTLAVAQPVPNDDENIPFLVTFGRQADDAWGDDDKCQIFFFKIPADFREPVFIRVFDPDCAGAIDEVNQEFNTLTRFSVYGGAGCITDEDARQTDPEGNFKSGNLLASKTFGSKGDYDNAWYTFGPFNPSEGERSDQYGGYILKVICEGVKGDDGNLYRYFMSTEADQNVPVENGNAFTYEYSFRMHADAYQISHIYPYIDDQVISLKQSNFDWDFDGEIRVVSEVTWQFRMERSGDNEWSESVYKVQEAERGKSLDIQFQKDGDLNINNNNVVFYLRNQYGELLPFYTAPIGGRPEFKGGTISKTPIRRTK